MHGERGQRSGLEVILEHPAKIDVADHIDIMQNEGLLLAGKKTRNLLESAAGVQKNVLPGDFDVHPKIVMRLQKLDDHLGEMMNVDDDVMNIERSQACEDDFQKRPPADLDKSFWAVICQGPQARSQPGGQYHCFHYQKF
jgi:hypothetical protein